MVVVGGGMIYGCSDVSGKFPRKAEAVGEAADLSACQAGSLRRAAFQAFVWLFVYWGLELGWGGRLLTEGGREGRVCPEGRAESSKILSADR